MILRRVTQHVKDQNWFAVGLDFMIVVIGVFFGIQVANWNDARTNEYRESEILETIYDELQEDRVEFQGGKESALVTISSASYVLEAAGLDVLNQLVMPVSSVKDLAISSNYAPIPEPIALSEDQKQRLWSSIVVAYYPTANATSIDALIGAGRLDLITNEAVRRNLQEYRNAAISLRGSQVETIKAFRTIAVTAGQERGYSPFYRGPEQEFIEQVMDDEHLLAVIATQREYAALHLRLIESADEDAKELLSQIEALGIE
ncbi:MAG: hypothetical protein JJ931_12855 [Henriciella sp.]|nr:hypothetical protein [Henriciella sp.]MBO6696297.1 hypothetical protein [Henriciella sp.]